MYRKHFGLQGHPFRLIPDTAHFFGGAQRGAVLEALIYAVTTGEGIVKVVGEVGSGKTMLCRTLVSRLPLSVEVAYLGNPCLTREEVLRAILQELGQVEAARSRDRLTLLDALQHHLITLHGEGCRVVVFVEEAQAMPLETLEEIRFLSNLETRAGKLLQIVLFGQPELDQRLAANELRQLRDRITQSFFLRPLSGEEVRDYVRFRLAAAGSDGREVFTPRALRLLARRSRGLMRRIHVLADKALLAAFADRALRVEARHVRRALRDDRPPRTKGVVRRRVPAALAASVLAMSVLGGVSAFGTFHTGHLDASEAETLAAASIPEQVSDTRSAAADSSAVSGTEAAGDGAALLQARLEATRQWLAQSRRGYTIQVMLTDDGDGEALGRFLAQPALQSHLSRIFVYPKRVGGRLRWTLLYGDYGRYREAVAALAEVPEVFQIFRPYVRNLARVRREMGQVLALMEEVAGS